MVSLLRRFFLRDALFESLLEYIRVLPSFLLSVNLRPETTDIAGFRLRRWFAAGRRIEEELKFQDDRFVSKGGEGVEKNRLASSFSGLCNCECKLNEIKQLIKVAAPPRGEVN